MVWIETIGKMSEAANLRRNHVDESVQGFMPASLYRDL